MANFELQVEGLTGVAIGSSDSSPTQDELTQFLKDGVKDVVSKMIKAFPQEIPKFSKTTDSSTQIAKVGEIVSVVREHDSSSILRPATEIPAQLRYEATDTDSLHYRSKYNPGFYEKDGNIHTVPAAGGSNNHIVVTQIYYDTGIARTDDETSIENFPEEYGYLVALYAAIKVIQAQLADINLVEEDPELAQSLTASLMSFLQDYQAAFVNPNAQQAQQGAR